MIERVEEEIVVTVVIPMEGVRVVLVRIIGVVDDDASIGVTVRIVLDINLRIERGKGLVIPF
jgi:uncharacterized OB-fold protein